MQRNYCLLQFVLSSTVKQKNEASTEYRVKFDPEPLPHLFHSADDAAQNSDQKIDLSVLFIMDNIQSVKLIQFGQKLK